MLHLIRSFGEGFLADRTNVWVQLAVSRGHVLGQITPVVKHLAAGRANLRLQRVALFALVDAHVHL